MLIRVSNLFEFEQKSHPNIGSCEPALKDKTLIRNDETPTIFKFTDKTQTLVTLYYLNKDQLRVPFAKLKHFSFTTRAASRS